MVIIKRINEKEKEKKYSVFKHTADMDHYSEPEGALWDVFRKK